MLCIPKQRDGLTGIGSFDTWWGQIDNTQLYNAALSDGELQSIFTSVAIPEPASLALLATAGAVVTVAGGHLRNYLYPRGVAVPATPENLARYEDLAASEAPAPAEAPPKPRAPTVTPSARTEYLEGGVRNDPP